VRELKSLSDSETLAASSSAEPEKLGLEIFMILSFEFDNKTVTDLEPTTHPTRRPQQTTVHAEKRTSALFRTASMAVGLPGRQPAFFAAGFSSAWQAARWPSAVSTLPHTPFS